MPSHSIEEVKNYLWSLPNFKSGGAEGADFNLQRFASYCEQVGNPQHDFPSIHVAGTNGKGSTCGILASVYQQAGYTTGIYTSPHLEDFSERFRINGRRISDDELLRFFQQYEELFTRFKLTYFELSTAIAFWWFSRQAVDLAMIEAGLGGRLDATNVVHPEASVITNISLDHTSLLGSDIRDIAREKAGIIKEGTPLVIGNVGREAKEVFRAVAGDKNAEVNDIQSLQVDYREGRYLLVDNGEPIEISMDGFAPVQRYNIAVAWRVVQLLGDRFPVDREECMEGMRRLGARYPNRGRFQQLDEHLQWYYDGAHNVDAVKAMKEAVSMVGQVDDAILVLALMKDKLRPELAKEFLEFKKIFYHELRIERAAPLTEVRRVLPQTKSFPACESSRNKWFKEFKSELVIFAGSFYFYTTIRDWLKSFNSTR